MLTTTAATLAIAAILLLGPLENSLRKTDRATRCKIGDPVADGVKRFERLPMGTIVAKRD